MRVTPGGVHDEHTRVLADGLRERLRTLLDDDVAPTNLTWNRAVQRRTIWVITIFQSRNNDFLREAGFTLRGDQVYDITKGGGEINLPLVL